MTAAAKCKTLAMRRREPTDWTDAARSDPGITMVELLAYVGDLLSRRQDEIAAEARLKTRRRDAFALFVLVAFVGWRCRGASHRHVDRCTAAQ